LLGEIKDDFHETKGDYVKPRRYSTKPGLRGAEPKATYVKPKM